MKPRIRWGRKSKRWMCGSMGGFLGSGDTVKEAYYEWYMMYNGILGKTTMVNIDEAKRVY